MGKNQIITDNSKVNVNLLKQNEELRELNKELIECINWHLDALDLNRVEFYEKYGFNMAEVFERSRQLIQKHEPKQ